MVSYSRKDAAVAESYRQAQIAAGHDVFMDTYSIRVGGNWQAAALARGIGEVDFFQLFWSKNSAGSPNCCAEWRYLNFRYVPLAGVNLVAKLRHLVGRLFS